MLKLSLALYFLGVISNMFKLKIHSFAKQGSQHIVQIIIYDDEEPTLTLGLLTQKLKKNYILSEIKAEIKEKLLEWILTQDPITIKADINQCLGEIENEI